MRPAHHGQFGNQTVWGPLQYV